MKTSRRRLLTMGALIVLLYLLGFVVLWLGGGYILNRSGRSRIQMPTGLALADVADWQPLLGNCQPDYQWPGGGRLNWNGGEISPRCDTIGWAYYPFWIWVKRKQPTLALGTAEGLPYQLLDPKHLPKGFRFHPLHGDQLRQAFKMLDAQELRP